MGTATEGGRGRGRRRRREAKRDGRGGGGVAERGGNGVAREGIRSGRCGRGEAGVRAVTRESDPRENEGELGV
ncbi:hypothetical protein Droror1_Dr00024228, partial [Drosera rotundifolia]